MIRDFNYGILSLKNKPSVINLKKPNLNQNATQCYNLFLNLPFIFYNYKIKIEDVWFILEVLLQIVQIIFSYKITENDLLRLARLIRDFLSSMVEKGIKLTPKMHHMIHYVTVIRNMGPLLNNWAMRIEAKHKFFTNIAKNVQCFKNITETLSSRHQQIACLDVGNFIQNITISRMKKKNK